MSTETNVTNANARSQCHTLSLYSCSDRVCRQTELYFIIVTLVQSTRSLFFYCQSSLVLCAELWFAVVLYFYSVYFHSPCGCMCFVCVYGCVRITQQYNTYNRREANKHRDKTTPRHMLKQPRERILIMKLFGCVLPFDWYWSAAYSYCILAVKPFFRQILRFLRFFVVVRFAFY